MGDPLLALVKPGGWFHISLGGKSLVTEPHHVIFWVSDLAFRITDCRCEQCEAHESGVLELPLLTAEEFAAALHEQELPDLDIAPHPDFLLPLQNGEPSKSLQALLGYAAVLSACGVTVEWVELRATPPGAWVKTVGFHFFQPNHVIVPGLLGQVAHDVYSICTPSVSTLARLEGVHDPRSYGFGYPTGLLEEITGEPTDEEKEAARELQSRALEVYEAEHGWTGYLVLGKGRQRTEVEARRELGQLAAWLDEHKNDARWPDIRGRWKRMRNILTAFADRGGMREAQELADGMNLLPTADDLSHGALAQIMAFAERPIPTDGFPEASPF
jgi:hypothetical protein